MPAPVDTGSGGPAAERAIVIAAQHGSDDAFGSLVRIHQRRAYSVVRAIVLSHEDAEDAVQEGFLHAHRALDRFRPDQPFGAWLYRIMANAALDLVRRRKVQEALTHLTDRQRSVIVLHDVEGFTHGEIGRTLGIPEGTARSDLHHARAMLRRLLQNIRSTS
jgi:RNA polymerase sigma-70 factor (ECF subfamily)